LRRDLGIQVSCSELQSLVHAFLIRLFSALPIHRRIVIIGQHRMSGRFDANSQPADRASCKGDRITDQAGQIRFAPIAVLA